MFDPDFFPTPPHIVRKMLEPYRMTWRRDGDELDLVQSVLEPSAGKGDILDWIRQEHSCGHRYHGPKLSAIEQSPDLVAILRQKDYRVVASDFLTFRPEHRIDLIAMNPPFSEGARHLLHAWRILDRGHIVCLLNAETIRNPWTEERKLLASIIEGHGEVEFLGPCFRTAERTTDVEVAMVRLRKAGNRRSELDFEFEIPTGDTDTMPDDGPAPTGTEIMRPDQMGALIRQYEMTKRAFVDYLRAREALAFYSQGIVDSDKIMDLAVHACGGGRDAVRQKEEAFETFKDSVRLQFWTHVLQMVGMEKYLTADFRKKFGQYVEQQGSMALTKENIGQILSTIMLNSKSIMQQAVVAVFDLFTAYHKQNRLHVEGWKTNDSWKVNRKVILPNYVRYEWGRFGRSHWRYDDYNDIDRAMSYLAGVPFEQVRTIEQSIDPIDGRGESTFFLVKCFKKGTLHLEFKDEKLWERFNVTACQGKGWLGHET